MTDKELMQQAFNALDKLTDLFPDFRGGHGQEAEDACNAALVVMADLAARLQQPQKTNQCAETCERAKLCDGCGVSLTQEKVPVAWRYTNAQGKTVIVKSSVKPYDDAVPLFTSEPQPKRKPWVDLTDAQIDTIGDKVANEKLVGVVPNFRVRFGRAIEAKLKETNR